MTAAASNPVKRVRASENALRIALKVVKDSGLPVEKLCVNGGQIEIHIAGVEGKPLEYNDEGLEKW